MKEHLLLVEGKDEKVLLTYLIASRELQGIVEVDNVGGNKSFPDGLRRVKKQSSFPSFRTITVVRDAEADATAAFESARGALKDAELPIPDLPNQWSAAFPHVQICIIPENRPHGCVEDLFLEAHRCHQEPLHACLDALRNCWAPNQLNPARWAKIYTAIILRAIPGEYASELGHAIQKAEFNDLLNHEPLLQLTRVLHRIQAQSNA